MAEDKFCLVCGAKISDKYENQCKDCYLETKEYMDGLDKNSSSYDLRTYYYNLKDWIYRTYKADWVKTNCNKLIAIALQNKLSNNDTALSDRVFKDVDDLITRKKKLFAEQSTATEVAESTKEETTEELQPHLKYATDGHAVDSDMEITIDDVLYSHEILHSCHKPVTDITEKSVTCDWFIPIEGINKGIYIEYNGMNTPDYKRNKQENMELYKKHDLPLIVIEKDEPKNDRQLFAANLIKEIQRKATEYYGAMPKWKK